MIVAFVCVQFAVLLCGLWMARTTFPESKKKRKRVMALASVLSVLAGAAVIVLILFWKAPAS